MGTWGVQSFENDAATDWAAGARFWGLSAVTEALDAVIDTEGAPDAETGMRAVAAAEVLAAALGHPGPSSTDADFGIGATDAAALEAVDAAELALERVAGEGSELAGLWAEAGEALHGAWLASLAELGARLRAGRAGEPPAPVVLPAPKPAPAATVEALAREVVALRLDLEAVRRELAESVEALRRDMREARG